ncbi:PA1571 family protein [Porticoccus sp.]
MNQHSKNKTTVSEPSPDFHGAAVIDEDGNEIPITEGMLQEAFEELEESAPNDLTDD